MLINVLNENLPDILQECLHETHNIYFINILNRYNFMVGEFLRYGVMDIRDYNVKLGTEYVHNTLRDKETVNQFNRIMKEVRQEFKMNEIEAMKSLFVNEMLDLGSEHIYIPITIKNTFLFFVYIENGTEFKKYMNLNRIEDIYDEYPALIILLSWGIGYIYSNDQEEKIQEFIQGVDFQRANYIHEKNYMVERLFDYTNLPFTSTIHSISMWNYEGQESSGYIDFMSPYFHTKEMDVKFKEPIFYNERNSRTIRKYMELSNEKVRIKAFSSECYIGGASRDDNWSIEGLGSSQENVMCTIQFEGYCKWRAVFKNEIIIYNGKEFCIEMKKEEGKLYEKMLDKHFSISNASISLEKIKALKQLLSEAVNQKHGTMIIISNEAEEEAKRLCECGRGIKIEPINMQKILKTDEEKGKDIIYNFTKIDGAVFIDEDCVCHAIGVIVDGRAIENSNQGRGARYNSGYTYVYDCVDRNIRCLCVIVSEDTTVDVIFKDSKSSI